MKTLHILFLVILFINFSCNSGNNKNQEQELVQKEAATVITVPQDSMIVIDEQTWEVMGKQPQENFKKANQKLASKDYKAAASETRQAADYIKTQAENTEGDIKESLKASEAELRKIASQLENDEKIANANVKEAFAKAYARLSNEYSEKAVQANKRNDNETAGKYLHLASASLKKSYAWSRKKINEKDRAITKDADALCEKLKKEGKSEDTKLREDLANIKERIKKEEANI